MNTDLVNSHQKDCTNRIIIEKGRCRLAVEDALNLGGRTRAEIDLKSGVIRKTWAFMGFTHSRVYELKKNAPIRVRDKSTLFEGYSLSSFGIYITARDKQIRLASTDDLTKARLIQNDISNFLREVTGKCPDASAEER